jgi:hypothetical protein
VPGLFLVSQDVMCAAHAGVEGQGAHCSHGSPCCGRHAWLVAAALLCGHDSGGLEAGLIPSLKIRVFPSRRRCCCVVSGLVVLSALFWFYFLYALLAGFMSGLEDVSSQQIVDAAHEL